MKLADITDNAYNEIWKDYHIDRDDLQHYMEVTAGRDPAAVRETIFADSIDQDYLEALGYISAATFFPHEDIIRTMRRIDELDEVFTYVDTGVSVINKLDEKHEEIDEIEERMEKIERWGSLGKALYGLYASKRVGNLSMGLKLALLEFASEAVPFVGGMIDIAPHYIQGIEEELGRQAMLRYYDAIPLVEKAKQIRHLPPMPGGLMEHPAEAVNGNIIGYLRDQLGEV